MCVTTNITGAEAFFQFPVIHTAPDTTRKYGCKWVDASI